jgi:hypothetical protein
MASAVLFSAATALAQQPAGDTPAEPTGAAEQPLAQALADDQPRKPDDATPAAEVIEVTGAVDRAEAGVSPLASEGWTAVQVGDLLPAGALIRTGLRSHVNLKFGETTVVSIRSATHASIDRFYRSPTTEHVHVGLGYGTVRGGSSEGRYRSDVTVSSTIATLAKRGTEGWELWVEPVTGRFRVSLADEGLVEAIQRLARDQHRSRTVRPGEYADQANIANMWINQASFDRLVEFYEADWLSGGDAEFILNQDRGLGFLAPSGGEVLTQSERVSADFARQQTRPDGTPIPPDLIVLQPIARPEGNFGTGPTFRVLVPAALRAASGRLVGPARPSRK